MVILDDGSFPLLGGIDGNFLFTTSNQNYMELNQELIQQLVEGKICVRNPTYAEITAEQLQKLSTILHAACPTDPYKLKGNCPYYITNPSTGHWRCFTSDVTRAVDIDDFFIKTSNYDTPNTHTRSKNAYLLLRRVH